MRVAGVVGEPVDEVVVDGDAADVDVASAEGIAVGAWADMITASAMSVAIVREEAMIICKGCREHSDSVRASEEIMAGGLNIVTAVFQFSLNT